MRELSLAHFGTVFTGALIAAVLFASLLAIKALRDYSTGGPKIQEKILLQYRTYAIFAVARLTFWAFLVALFWTISGAVIYLHITILLDTHPTIALSAVTASITLLGAIAMQFFRILLYCPAVIAASSHYRLSRFYKLWRHLTPGIFKHIDSTLILAGILLSATSTGRLVAHEAWGSAALLVMLTLALLASAIWSNWHREASPVKGVSGSREHPNIIMIGSDTLRADRLGVAGYQRPITPNLDALASRGTWFENCYIPCGRTAPSLVSLLTGTWPHTHGIRDNFVARTDIQENTPSLPRLLSGKGYRTSAISDWCGADLGKFALGFDELDLPSDSWNIRYLLRQGPKDLRLFLSLFLRNRLGKMIVPEIYYLGGVPLTDALGRDSRQAISRLASNQQPFFLNIFFSTTHPPFGSEYPYYTEFSDPDYSGESKFVMARLADPFDIIRRQGEPRKEFDLDQILDLYDGCVKRFDTEVGKLVEHVAKCKLDETTIIVLYSDHGMEFFEHGTWGQGNSVLGDHSSRIPMIILDPRQPKGQRVSSIVRSIDIAPTLLNLCQEPAHPSMDGVSLAGCLEGDTIPGLPAYTESGIWLTDLPGMPDDHLRYPNLLEILDIQDYKNGTFVIGDKYRDLIIEAKDRMVRLGRWKLTYQPTTTSAIYRLFDIEADPGCHHDVIDRHPEIAQELKNLLINWLCQDSRRKWIHEHLILAD